MSRHEGVSCDNCLMSNFEGKRFKCLICYDYDLCKSCHDMEVTTSRHLATHPMQCILTRNDYELYYGGESVTPESPPSFVCPFCAKLGFTESLLQEHVTKEHSHSHTEVVCPVCAALPTGDPNLVTDDLAAHLTMEHRSPRDVDDPMGNRHIRRMFYPGRGLRHRNHRTANFTGGPASSSISTGGSATDNNNTNSVVSSIRDPMDPIAELLSQLSGVRHSPQLPQSVTTASQLQELQTQLQLERQRAAEIKQQFDRFSGKSQASNGTAQNANVPPSRGAPVVLSSKSATSAKKSTSNQSDVDDSRYLLSCLDKPTLTEGEMEKQHLEDADRAQFVQELILSMLSTNPDETPRPDEASSSNQLSMEPAVPADCPLLASTPSHVPTGASQAAVKPAKSKAESEQSGSFNNSSNRNDDTGVGNSVLTDDFNSPPGALTSNSEHQHQNLSSAAASAAVGSRSAPLVVAAEQRKSPEWGYRDRRGEDQKDSDEDCDRPPSPTPNDQHRALTLQGRSVLVTGGSPIGLHGNRDEMTSSGLSKHVR